MTQLNEQAHINKLLILIFAFFCLYSLFITIPSSSFFFDEGWYADIGNNLANGKTLYKDISAPYGPVVFYIYALLIYVFGKQFIVFRIVGLLIILLNGFITYKLASLFFTKRKIFIVIAVALSLVVLTSYQGCRITASTIAGMISLSTVYFHFKYLNDGKKNQLIFLGIFLCLSLLTKQNVFAIDAFAHGSFMIMNSLSSYIKRNEVDLSYLLLPLVTFLCFLSVYIIIIFPYSDLVIKDTISSIFIYKSSDIGIPFPTPFEIITMNLTQLRNSLYLYSIFPFVIAGILILWSSYLKKNTIPMNLIFLFSITVLHYLLIYPLSDYSHYTRATMFFPLSVCALYLISKDLKDQKAIFLIALGLAFHLYNSPIRCISNINRLVSFENSNLPYHSYIREVPQEATYLDLITEINKEENENILIIGHANVLNYFTGRMSLSRSSMISHTYLDIEDEKEVINSINKNNVSILIEAPSARENIEIDELKILGSYIKHNFRIYNSIDGFNFWMLKQ